MVLLDEALGRAHALMLVVQADRGIVQQRPKAHLLGLMRESLLQQSGMDRSLVDRGQPLWISPCLENHHILSGLQSVLLQPQTGQEIGWPPKTRDSKPLAL